MQNDTPAAFPLIGLIAGMALAPLLVNPRAAIVACILVALLHRRIAAPMLFAALGLIIALNDERRIAASRAALARFDPARFVAIQAPLERDWSRLERDAGRDPSYVLRARTFRANGIEMREPIAIYAGFEPPQIAMEESLRAEGFVRLNDRDQYVATIKSPRLLAYDGELPRWHPAAWNRALANRLEQHADSHPDEVALAQALVLGRGELLTREMRDSFRRGGTYHLLVFSALQIAFAAGLLAALLRWLHAPRASDWLLVAFAAIAPLFIGPTASVSRASIGIGLYAVARIAKRPTSLENLWCVAALIRLIVEPRDLTDASFHLTYAGAGALLFIGRHLVPWRWAGHALSAEIAIAPLTLLHFRQYALGGSLLTLAMAPVILAMLIVSSIACFAPSAATFGIIAMLHRVCMLLNSAGLSGWFAAPPLPALIAGASATLLAIALLRGRIRAVAIVAAMLIPSGAAVIRSAIARDVEHPRLTFLDVGQGDAIAIRTPSATVLVDGGRGERVLRLLGDRGVRRIDAVVLSHAHPDHCDALPAVIEQFDVRALWVSPRRFRGDCATRLLEAAQRTSTPVHIVRDGDVRTVGDVRITAHAAHYTFRRAPENNASLLLRLEAAGRTFLLTGDIEREAELYFADRELRADLLKVAHHGSRSSTSPAILDVIQPRIAVISCGRRNLFGHPHASVLANLAARGVRTWRTDRDGSIDVEVRGGGLYVAGRFD